MDNVSRFIFVGNDLNEMLQKYRIQRNTRPPQKIRREPSVGLLVERAGLILTVVKKTFLFG